MLVRATALRNARNTVSPPTPGVEDADRQLVRPVHAAIKRAKLASSMLLPQQFGGLEVLGSPAVPIPAERRRSFLARQVATMALSHVQVDTPMAMVRAAAWCNSLARMGVHLPLFVVHDIGVMLSMPRGAGGYALRAARGAARAHPAAAAASSRSSTSTAGCSRTSPRSEVTERLAGLRLRDEMVAVLLSRILGDTYNRWRDRSKAAGAEPLPLDLGISARSTPPITSATSIRAPLWGFLEHLVAQSMHIYTAGRADRPRHRAPARPVQGGQRVGQRGARRRDRSRRSVRRARLARGERRRELLARPPAERARDAARDRARRRSRSTATRRSSARATSTRSCCPSSPTTARSSSRRSSTTSCSTTAARSSARTSAGCSTS